MTLLEEDDDFAARALSLYAQALFRNLHFLRALEAPAALEALGIVKSGNVRARNAAIEEAVSAFRHGAFLEMRRQQRNLSKRATH